MTLTENSEYSRLKNEVLLRIGTSDRYSQLLSNLKELFSDDINSPRRFEQITTVGELMRTLEARDVLSKDNVGPLKEIARRLHNSIDLLQKINEYECNLALTDGNYYESENVQTSSNRVPVESFTINNSNTGISTLKKQKIVEAVIENIGTFWRDLARGLDIKEKVIDDINENHKNTNQKAKIIMELYNKKADPNNNVWFYDLIDALETCRRRDLAKKLKKITVMNI